LHTVFHALHCTWRTAQQSNAPSSQARSRRDTTVSAPKDFLALAIAIVLKPKPSYGPRKQKPKQTPLSLSLSLVDVPYFNPNQLKKQKE